MKPFSKWSVDEVEDRFGVVQIKQSNLLKEWLTVRGQISTEDEKRLKELSESLQDHVHDWNEAELKLKFVAPLLFMVKFDHEKYQSFVEREISVSFENETLSGVVDFIVAMGRRVPRKPYFFLNEYKKEQESSNDPLGQLLIAMVAAQKLNNDGHPIYGAYVTGRLWFFLVLHDLEYSVSVGHNSAREEELMEIFGILQNSKGIIEKLISGAESDRIQI